MLQKERDPEIKALVMILLGGTSESICRPVWTASAVTSRKYFALQIGANRFITRQARTLQVSLGLFLCIVCKDMVVLLQKPMSKYLEHAFKDKRNFWKHTFDLEFPIKMLTLFLSSWDHCPWTHFSLTHQNCTSSREWMLLSYALWNFSFFSVED